mgnify:FL=1
MATSIAVIKAVQQQLEQLVLAGSYQSAVSLAQGLLIQSPVTKTPLKGGAQVSSAGSKVRTLELLGQALMGLGDYHRAINYFSQAEQELTRKAHPLALRPGVRPSPGAYTPTSTGTSTPASLLSRGGSIAGGDPADAWLESDDAAKTFEICFHICTAYVRLGAERQALQALEKVPDRKRTAAMNLCAGRLYQRLGSNRAATAAFKLAWKANPFAIDAARGLVELGMPTEEILDMTEGVLESSAPWIMQLIEAHGHEWTHRPKNGLTALEAMGPAFDGHSECLLAKARMKALQKDYDGAVELFSRAHTLDDTAFAGMDDFAEVLYRKEDTVRLNRLTQKMLQLDDSRPEGWISAAYYSLAKGDYDKALEFVDQAIQADSTSYNAYCAKGEILMRKSKETNNAHMDAINAYKRAWQVRKGIRACSGLVDAYLKDGNVGQARGLSREARTGMPESAEAWVLLGKVYSHLGAQGSAENFEKAKRAFKKALTIDPCSVEATYETVDVLVAEGLFIPAIEMLKKSSGFIAGHTIHAKLADVFILNKQYGEAIEQCQYALAINSNSHEALRAMERAERGLRGLDPEGDEEEGEDGGEDHEGDSF